MKRQSQRSLSTAWKYTSLEQLSGLMMWCCWKGSHGREVYFLIDTVLKGPRHVLSKSGDPGHFLILTGPLFIVLVPLFNKCISGQSIWNVYLQKNILKKVGTPTMGGLMMIKRCWLHVLVDPLAPRTNGFQVSW